METENAIILKCWKVLHVFFLVSFCFAADCVQVCSANHRASCEEELCFSFQLNKVSFSFSKF